MISEVFQNILKSKFKKFSTEEKKDFDQIVRYHYMTGNFIKHDRKILALIGAHIAFVKNSYSIKIATPICHKFDMLMWIKFFNFEIC